VPDPDLDSCPESGLGIFIMRSFTRVSYRAGRPNVLVLSRTVADSTVADSMLADSEEVI
jgi:hypothetical protein